MNIQNGEKTIIRPAVTTISDALFKDSSIYITGIFAQYLAFGVNWTQIE